LLLLLMCLLVSGEHWGLGVAGSGGGRRGIVRGIVRLMLGTWAHVGVVMGVTGWDPLSRSCQDSQGCLTGASQGLSVAIAAKNRPSGRSPDCSAQSLQALCQDGRRFSTCRRPCGSCLGESFESAGARWSPASARFGYHRYEGQALGLAVSGCVQILSFVALVCLGGSCAAKGCLPEDVLPLWGRDG